MNSHPQARSGKLVKVSTLEPQQRDTRLDPYVDRYAARAHDMRASAVRALFAVANRPEVVSLAGGMPNIKDLPLAELGGQMEQLISQHGVQAMQYGSGQGELFLREKICEVMAEEAIHAHPDDVTVTVGSQQGLELITRIFINPGDMILVEAPSYVGALGTFQSYQADIRHIEMDDDGLIPERFAEAIAVLRRAGKNIKFLYTIPNFNNPAGISQTLERRRQIVEIAAREGVLVVEDNPYGLLNLDSDPLPAMRSLDADNVLYLGSFSKTFAPGFRVGWVLAPHAVREKLVLAQESATLCPPVFSQFAVASYLEHNDWRSQITVFKDMYRERRDAMLQALPGHMPEGSTWTHPAGGFFVWLTLPEGLDSQAMLPRAVTARVAYTPGTAFFADGLGARNIRLSYCFPTADRIREGIRRLGEVIAHETMMNQTFGVVGHQHSELPYAPGPDLR